MKRHNARHVYDVIGVNWHVRPEPAPWAGRASHNGDLGITVPFWVCGPHVEVARERVAAQTRENELRRRAFPEVDVDKVCMRHSHDNSSEDTSGSGCGSAAHDALRGVRHKPVAVVARPRGQHGCTRRRPQVCDPHLCKLGGSGWA